jgi:hypothetical protein
VRLAALRLDLRVGHVVLLRDRPHRQIAQETNEQQAGEDVHGGVVHLIARNAGGELELRLEVGEEVLQVEVEDKSPQLPRPRPEALVGGKGLLVVGALAEWGVRAAGEGKTVWARVPLKLSVG